jgi:hypothetical protein
VSTVTPGVSDARFVASRLRACSTVLEFTPPTTPLNPCTMISMTAASVRPAKLSTTRFVSGSERVKSTRRAGSSGAVFASRRIADAELAAS